MATALEVLEAQVMGLSRPERSRLLEHLIASLDTDDVVEQEWNALADAREDELEGGCVQAVPNDEVVARLRGRFPG